MPDGQCVHIVDDDAAFRDSLRLLLESAGYSVAEYADGMSFATIAATATGCALVDVNMPGLDGISLQEMLTQRGIGLPVIMMTGDADVPMAVRAMRAGAVDFVEKPFDSSDLRAVIDRALARRSTSIRPDPAVDAFKVRFPKLTDREREVLQAVIAGHATKVIAYEFGLSPRTVHTHRMHIGEKLGIVGLSNLVRIALAAGVEPLTPRKG